MPYEFYTPKEIERMKRNASIRAEFERLTALDGALSVNRKVNYIARDPRFNIGASAIRVVLKEAKLI